MSRTFLAVAAALVIGGCNLGPDDARWVTARRGELVVGVDVTGQLASTESHPLGPPPIRHVWNFKIAHMTTEGDSIKKGEPVLRFDVSELRRELEEYQNEADSASKQLTAHRASSRMALRENKLAVEQARAAERKAELKTAGGTDVLALNEIKRARLDHEFATYALEVASRKLKAKTRQDRAELDRLIRVKERAEQRVAQLKEAMGQMQVPAPIDGTVLYVTDWQGNKKKIGDNAWRAERIVEVVSLEHMKAEGEVDEMDASRVRVGQTVRIRLDANADVELSGKVVEIQDNVQRRAPEDPRKVVKLEIELEKSPDVDLRPGMRYRGTVETDRVTDVLVIPLDAVFASADGAYVYKKDGADAVATRVTLGRRGTEMVEVTAGLAPGDRIALTGATDDEDSD
jgi:RND family efflux transporter MFP subunit